MPHENNFDFKLMNKSEPNKISNKIEMILVNKDDDHVNDYEIKFNMEPLKYDEQSSASG